MIEQGDGVEGTPAGDAGVPDLDPFIGAREEFSEHNISVLWAWISRDPRNGQEGILSHYVPGLGHMPMVGADEQRIESLRPIAELAAVTNPDYTVRLIRFTHREEMP